jgi:hypothetical protein
VDQNGDGKRGTTSGGRFEPTLPNARITVYDVPRVGGVPQAPVKIGEGVSGPTGVYLISGQWSAGDKTVVVDPVPGYNKVNPVGVRAMHMEHIDGISLRRSPYTGTTCLASSMMAYGGVWKGFETCGSELTATFNVPLHHLSMLFVLDCV